MRKEDKQRKGNLTNTQNFSDNDLKDEDLAQTPSDVVKREVGEDFYNIYHVERCSV